MYLPPIAVISLSISDSLLLMRTLSAKETPIDPYSEQVWSRASTSALNCLSLATSALLLFNAHEETHEEVFLLIACKPHPSFGLFES